MSGRHLLIDEDAISYFRAILSSGEKSPRVMELLNFIVNLNPSLYTAWYNRIVKASPSRASKIYILGGTDTIASLSWMRISIKNLNLFTILL